MARPKAASGTAKKDKGSVSRRPVSFMPIIMNNGFDRTLQQVFALPRPSM